MTKKKRRRHRARTASGQLRKNPGRTKSRGVTKRSAKARHHKYGTFQYNRKRRRGRTYRRNPSMSASGVMRSLVDAGRDAAIITVAQAATAKLAGFIPGGTSPAVTTAKQVGVGLVLSLAARKMAPRYAHQVLVGALLAPVQTAAKALPVIGPALSGYGNHTARMGKYLEAVKTPVGAYVPWSPAARAGGMGSYLDDAARRRAAYYG